MLLYLLPPIILPSSAHPPTKTLIILAFHLKTLRQPFVVYRSSTLIIAHRTRVINPQLASRRSYQLRSGFNHAPPQPSHHSSLSVDPPVEPPLLPSSSLVGPLPCSSSTQPHINTNIHPSKQTPFCVHNFHCTFTELTNSSFFTHHHTASLWGNPTQSRSHPPCKPHHLHPQYSLHAHS